jgi:hypothetical protein
MLTLLFIYFGGAGKPKALHMLGKCSSTRLCPQPKLIPSFAYYSVVFGKLRKSINRSLTDNYKIFCLV